MCWFRFKPIQGVSQLIDKIVLRGFHEALNNFEFKSHWVDLHMREVFSLSIKVL